MELLAMLVLIAFTAVLIVWPVVAKGRSAEGGSAPAVPEPKGRADLAAIKELDFDFATGKIAEDDYRMLRRRYEARAVAALHAPPSPETADDGLEAEIRAARSRRFCVSCGAVLPAAARFCPSCGTAQPAAGGAPPVGRDHPAAEGRR